MISVNEKLKDSYKQIGASLLKLEKNSGFYSYFLKESPRSIQIDLAYVPTEIISSYLEDLLDFTINDESLFIYKQNLSRIYNLLALLGLIIAMSIGMNLAYAGVELSLSITIVLLIAIPSGFLWHFSPRVAPNRRLFFAKVISQEIDRRKGGDTKDEKLLSKISLSKLIKPKEEVPELSRSKLK